MLVPSKEEVNKKTCRERIILIECMSQDEILKAQRMT